MTTGDMDRPSTPELRAAIVLGIGLGGFFDGIVLHQILQWHHMLSSVTATSTVAGIELNTLADGLFHLVAWFATVLGVILLARSRPPGGPVPVRHLVAGALIGWGLFNLVEGIVDHHILRIHHVRAGPDETLYDVAFLIWGALMLAAGLVLSRRATRV